MVKLYINYLTLTNRRVSVPNLINKTSTSYPITQYKKESDEIQVVTNLFICQTRTVTISNYLGIIQGGESGTKKFLKPMENLSLT